MTHVTASSLKGILHNKVMLLLILLLEGSLHNEVPLPPLLILLLL
jgi:hypothetical protein